VTFNFNSELYADPNLAEGVDYARRHRRHERFDDTLARTDDAPKTTILAPHGGGIEPGTSELCLAVAGYHPAGLPQTPPAGVRHDYWMFEGLRERDNSELHVTSTGCDDGVAVSLCAGSLNALALHGFQPGPPGMSEDDQVVLVGGGNAILRGYLMEGLRNAVFDVRDAGQHGELDGDARCNIVNRTLLGMGAQLELSTPLRDAMFAEHNRRSRRKHTTTLLFWIFVAVCRDALDRLEAEQIVVRPELRCLEADLGVKCGVSGRAAARRGEALAEAAPRRPARRSAAARWRTTAPHPTATAAVRPSPCRRWLPS
jgi:phage replication-related protein YjqB (UPF0714/DUF867 family)